MANSDRWPIVSAREHLTASPADTCARLENVVDLLRREWRAGFPAGMAYDAALTNLQQLRQTAAELDAVIADLEAYKSLSVERRAPALVAIADAITRHIRRISVASNPSHSKSGTLTAPTLAGDGLYRLSPAEFEMAVASLLVARGFTNVEVIGGANDLGVDIRCYDQSGNLVVVQCKRYAPDRRISSSLIQTFMGMAHFHGAHGKLYVTTSHYTKQAIALAQEAGVELIDGDALAALVHELRTDTRYPEPAARVETWHPDPGVPVVLPDFYSDRPADAAATARHAWLSQLHPATPVISGYAQWDPTTTEDEKRAWHQAHARLLRLTPAQFRKACILSEVAGRGAVGQEIRLLENQDGSILDYAIMASPRPWLRRCHHLPGEQAVTAAQTDQFIRFAEANGYEATIYSTTGLFTAEALLQQANRGLDGLATEDGWYVALWLLPDMHWYSKGKDFIALAQQPDWPAKVLEGTERRGWLRKFFG